MNVWRAFTAGSLGLFCPIVGTAVSGRSIPRAAGNLQKRMRGGVYGTWKSLPLRNVLVVFAVYRVQYWPSGHIFLFDAGVFALVYVLCSYICGARIVHGTRGKVCIIPHVPYVPYAVSRLVVLSIMNANQAWRL